MNIHLIKIIIILLFFIEKVRELYEYTIREREKNRWAKWANPAPKKGKCPIEVII